MAQKVLRVYVDHSLGSPSHPTKIPTLAPHPLKNFGGQTRSYKEVVYGSE